MKLGAMQGALAVLIQESIADGILTGDEITAINKKSQKVFAYAKHFIDSLPVVYGVKA